MARSILVPAGVLSLALMTHGCEVFSPPSSGGPEDAAAAMRSIVSAWEKNGISKDARVATIALSSDFRGAEPFDLPGAATGLIARWFSENGSGNFLRALERERDTLTWGLGRPTPEREEEFLERFSMLVSEATRAGGRVRVVAHGDSAAFAARGAARAKRALSAPGPVLERLIGVGANAKLLTDRAGDVYAQAAKDGAVAEWINLWSDSRAVARGLYADSWRLGGEKPVLSVRPWPPYPWPAVLASVLSRGAEGLPPEETLEVSPSEPAARRAAGRDAENRPSYIEMLEAKKKSEEASAPAEKLFRLGESGWAAVKLSGVDYSDAGNPAVVWKADGRRVRVYWAKAGDPGWKFQRARERCAAKGLSTAKATHHGRPVEICAQVGVPDEDSADAYHDYFTIEDKGGWISVVYSYWPNSARHAGFAKFTEIIESLKPVPLSP